MRGAIVIPSRMASTRLANKPLLPLGNVPMVVRVAQQAQASAQLAGGEVPVLVASEDQIILRTAQDHGIAVIHTPACPNGSARVAWVAANAQLDWVINWQCDEPFVACEDVALVLAALQSGQYPMVSLWRPAQHDAEVDDPHMVKVVVNDHGFAQYFSRAAIPYTSGPAPRPTSLFRIHIGFYGYQVDCLRKIQHMPEHPLETSERLEQLRGLFAGISIFMIQGKTKSGGIDTLADYHAALAHIA